MNDLSKNIILTFDNITHIFKEVSSLLQDADSFMEAEGYHSMHGNSIGTSFSRHIQYPDWWVAPYASRYYVKDEEPFLIKGIGVVFLDVDRNAIDPLILVGCFRSSAKEIEDRGVDYNYLSLSWFRFVNEKIFQKEYKVEGLAGTDGAIIRAVELEAVDGTSALQDYVISPLLEMTC